MTEICVGGKQRAELSLQEDSLNEESRGCGSSVSELVRRPESELQSKGSFLKS